MRLTLIALTMALLMFACQSTSSNSGMIPRNTVAVDSPLSPPPSPSTSIRDIDFKNFIYLWTKEFNNGKKTFELKNGKAEPSADEKLSLNSISYISVTDKYEEEALVVVEIDAGNATYNMLYVYAIENGKPKVLESFGFGEDNIYFGTAFAAHSELIIERYIQKGADPECCPSNLEISYYKWQKDKFVLLGEPQQVPNGYVERTKRKQ